MYEVETRELDEQDVAVVRGNVAWDVLESWLSGTFGTLAAHLQTVGVAIAGMPFARFRRRGQDGAEVEAGLPVSQVVDHKDEVEPDVLPGGVAATTWHRGPYHEIGPAYEAIEAWVARTGVVPVGAPWEVYHSDPEQEPDASTWLTEVVQPYREA